MPRTSRFSVEFPVAGKTWFATFAHLHSEAGLPVTEKMLVKHLTTCSLIIPGTLATFGTAPCSMKDDYNWQKGINLSLKRALAAAGFATESKMDGKVLFTDTTSNWSEALHSFYHELKIKAYPPHIKER